MINHCQFNIIVFQLPDIKEQIFSLLVSFKIIYFLFVTTLGLRCCRSSVQAFSSCGEQGLLFLEVHELFIVATSLVEQLRHQSALASVVVGHRLNCPMACGIFLNRD